MKAVIVDDNVSFREAIEDFMFTELNLEIIGRYPNGEEFLQSNSYYYADLVLMDIEMPLLNGIEATKRALWFVPEMKTIAVTSYHEKAYLTELISAGFQGCVFKNRIFEELTSAIDCVSKGLKYFPGGMKL